MPKQPRKDLEAVYLCGPSGVGKSSVALWLEARSRIRRIPPVVTRDRRESECHGKDAWFCSQQEFQHMEDSSKLIGVSAHNNTRYAYMQRDIDEISKEGYIPLYDFYAPRLPPLRAGSHVVYLLPDSTEWLLRRIAGRGGVSPEELRSRTRFVHEELKWVRAEGQRVIDDFVGVSQQMTVSAVGDAVLASIQKRRGAIQQTEMQSRTETNHALP